ncbi:hypothetical protein O6H91_04G053500 [Diphasiastrum complanatum]|uniref:Uncharacterized protein n=1 Tax=Diphasiastrum complanatum TaxID=34168 RepID=A0ACC2DXA7_DIPCM|nr:hypothetical protein O6H91_04G053500 [Diphasiastrum complanatum]
MEREKSSTDGFVEREREKGGSRRRGRETEMSTEASATNLPIGVFLRYDELLSDVDLLSVQKIYHHLWFAFKSHHSGSQCLMRCSEINDPNKAERGNAASLNYDEES